MRGSRIRELEEFRKYTPGDPTRKRILDDFNRVALEADKYVDLAAEYGWQILAGAARFASTPAGPVLDVDVAPEDGGIDVAPEGTRGPGPRPAEREADRLRVAGGVLLDQAELRVTLAPGTPPGGAPLTIVDNTGDGQVAGTFRGLPEGATVTGRTADGRAARFRIDDRGGDGNDVVLEPLRAPDPAPRPVTLAAVADQAVDEGEQLALRLHADPGATARALASTRWWCGALRRHPRLADTRTVTITVTRPPPAIAAYLACTWPNAIMN